MRASFASLAAVLVVSVGCAPAPDPAPTSAPTVDLSAEERAIRELGAEWLKALQAGDHAAEGRFFASDGTAYREGQLYTGSQAIADYNVKNGAANPKMQISWTTEDVTVAESGDLAYETGEVQMSGLGADGTGKDRLRFLTVWKKVDGTWKVAHDMSMSTMPPSPQ